MPKRNLKENVKAVSYTHLDVYKRQGYVDTEAVENYLKEELKGTVPVKYENEQGRVTVIK